MNQLPRVRADHYCVGCDGPKDAGLLLCWPCHHRQKARNHGGYSVKMNRELDQFEKLLEAKAKGGKS